MKYGVPWDPDGVGSSTPEDTEAQEFKLKKWLSTQVVVWLSGRTSKAYGEDFNGWGKESGHTAVEALWGRRPQEHGGQRESARHGGRAHTPSFREKGSLRLEQ